MDIKELIKHLNDEVILINRRVSAKQLLDMDLNELENVGELIGFEITKIKSNPLTNENTTSNTLNKFLKLLKDIYNAKKELINEYERRNEIKEQIEKIKEILNEKEEKTLKKAKKGYLQNKLNELVEELNKLN